MRNLAAALLILSLTASCSRAPEHDTRSSAAVPPPVVVQTTSSAPLSVAASTSVVAVTASSTTTVPTPATIEPGTDSAPAAATIVVEAMIGGYVPPDLPDGALWVGVVGDSHVIQATTLTESANRATVAISIAFENAADHAVVEPVGLRVELLRTEPTGWRVLGIGYL